jgi:Protein of unknown function (DUF3306)
VPLCDAAATKGNSRRARKGGKVVLFRVALPALVFLADGAMAQAQENSLAIVSSGLHEAAFVRTPPIEKSPFGRANLPPIESIGTGSNIRPFLASGVPADLTRAALRRAWSTDPAIRDFVGLSENSWDFNAPGGVPGFGCLTTDGPRRVRPEMMGEAESLDPERLAAER